ncbi:MAG: hypothetical protein IKT08_01700 [Bacteroidales bacterium]|nr:hypothetical protein [Bacteroidales bacterium]
MSGFFKRVKDNKTSTILQTLVVLLLLAVIIITLVRVPQHYLMWTIFGTAILLIVLQFIRLKFPLLFIDRIFAYHSGKQVVLALFVFVICFDFALCLFPGKGLRTTFTNFISYKTITEEVSDEVVIKFDTTQYKPNANEIAFVEKPAFYKKRSDYIKYGIVYILGLVVFSGMLIATITRFMATRADRYKKGANTYKNIRNHYVILGYGPSCPSIIRNISKRGKLDPRTRFLLLTSQDPETIRLNIQSQLQDLEEKTVIYSGDIDAASHLERLNIKDAMEVYILGEGREAGRDSRNLECAKMVKTIREQAPVKSTLPVNIQFDKPGSYSTIKRITMPKQYYKNDNAEEVTYLHPFNFYENWARLLWGYHHLDCYSPLDRGQMVAYGPDSEPLPTQKHVHLVIAGFDEMGVALLLQALRVCHYPNYNESTGANKTHITVVDPKMNELLPGFKSQYPYLEQIRDIEIDYEAERIESVAFRNKLADIAGQAESLLTIAICFSDADSSLSAALTLPEPVYYQIIDGEIVPNNNTEILVRQEIKSGLADVLDAENGKYANVKIFGIIDKGVDDKLLDDNMAIIINAHYHFKYGSTPPRDFFKMVEEDKDKAFSEAAKDWIGLNEDKRFANRYQTEIYKTYQTYRPLLERNPELLYQTEHMRWCAERSITGYRDQHDPDIKSSVYQIHHLIVPYHDLNDLEKGKDKDVLHIMDKVIALSESLEKNIL